LTLPFTAFALPAVWHAAVIAVLAVIAGLVLSTRAWSLWKVAALGAVIGLAGAAPGEAPVLLGVPSLYWRVSLVVVPAVTAGLAVVVVAGRRILAARESRAFAVLSRPVVAASVGAVAAFVAMGVWTALGTMPNGSDRNGPLNSYARTGDERKIIACVVSGRGEELLGSSAREEATIVTVLVRLRRPPSWYFHDLVGISLPAVVTLRDPLGTRTVIDEWSGRTVPEVIRSERNGFGFGC
jgi:hypothetical protein